MFQFSYISRSNFLSSKEKPTLEKLLIFREMDHPCPNLKKLLFLFFEENFLGIFHHCCFRLFHFSPLIFATDFYHKFLVILIVDCIFSCHQLCCFFVRHLVFVSLYECYGFDEAFFTLWYILLYSLSPHWPQFRECYGFERAIFTLRYILPYAPSQHLAQPAFIKVSLGAGSSSLKVAGLLTEIRNTYPVHLFV